MIQVFDAFSGIGGFRSAFERVGGFKTVGWCKIDRFAQKSYRALFDTGDLQIKVKRKMKVSHNFHRRKRYDNKTAEAV